jgi:hypothetical protein
MGGTCANLRSTARGAVVATLILFSGAQVPSGRASAADSGPFMAFAGSWRGSGEITLSDGHSEPIRCVANYRVGASGATVNDTLRCASDSYNFDLAADVSSRDGALSGTWQETSKGVSGTLSGSVNRGRMQIQVRGPSFAAGLGLSVSGNQQNIQIRSLGTEFTGASIRLRR